MRLIPVIDLLNGQAVHAIKGNRAKYKPVKSVLCDTPDAISLARAFRDRLGLNEIYIADLNAIQDSGRTCHRDLIATLAHDERLDIILDAGIPDSEDAQSWLRLGIRKTVIGAETLHTMHALQEIPAVIDPERLVFSLDMRAGKIVSSCPKLASMPPLKALENLHSSGWQEVILLDLNRVGSGEGIDRMLLIQAQSNFPRLKLLAGGGIANTEQLLDLKSLGIAGVLVATALHRGVILAQHLSALGGSQLKPNQ
jgi:phosphoribosylformimino-5-aminoimidazole carboxamide ribotide isomerase